MGNRKISKLSDSEIGLEYENPEDEYLNLHQINSLNIKDGINAMLIIEKISLINDNERKISSHTRYINSKTNDEIVKSDHFSINSSNPITPITTTINNFDNLDNTNSSKTLAHIMKKDKESLENSNTSMQIKNDNKNKVRFSDFTLDMSCMSINDTTNRNSINSNHKKSITESFKITSNLKTGRKSNFNKIGVPLNITESNEIDAEELGKDLCLKRLTITEMSPKNASHIGWVKPPSCAPLARRATQHGCRHR